MNIFKFINHALTIISFISFFQYSCGLYEDQIKKFDWRKLNIGAIKDGSFLPNNIDRFIVTTNENVLAALSASTGEILWRQIFEKDPRGDIKFIIVPKDSTTAAANREYNLAFDILTVSGVSPTLVRGWCSETGNLEFEWSFTPLQPEKAENSFYFYEDFYLYHVIPVQGSHFEITQFFASTGQTNGKTTKVTAPWLKERNQCFFIHPYYSCDEGDKIFSIDLTTENPQIIKTELPSNRKSDPKELKGSKTGFVVDRHVMYINGSKSHCDNVNLGNVMYQFLYKGNPLTIYAQRAENRLHIQSLDSQCSKAGISLEIPYEKYYGTPKFVDFDCSDEQTQELTCRIIISSEDGAIIYVEQNNVAWIREEALANIIATELIDLPLSDSEGAIETELKSKPEDNENEWNIFEAFMRRITAQSHLLKSTILNTLGLGLPLTATQEAGLVRDSFGLHKMLVILTKSGKIFGIDNLTGKTHWIHYLSNFDNFRNGENMKLFIQRTSKHFPYEPVCSIVAREKIYGGGILYEFNPINGKPIGNGVTKLSSEIKQVALLPETEKDFLKGLLIITQNDDLLVFPERTAPMADGLYIFTADKNTSTLTGFIITYKNNNLSSLPIWYAYLGGHGNTHEIIAVAAKNPNERVHSQGRVLSDRSVLYKYINPNLVAVVTQSMDNIHKYVMNMHLIDVVSGSIVYSMTHRKVRKPLHIVHSENWLVYSYYNDKVRRTEITTVELYEGKVQTNSTTWSSLDAPPLPLIEKQSFIIPTTVEAMRETITERGITNKDVLIGTASGGIVEMPWALLDPRRPVSNQAREEGSFPYIPELPMPTENIINYNQTVSRIKNIYTAPSGLESTCLVVAYGLDLFVTRVSPSKTFDLLKEDFDYFLISVVLSALIVGSCATKHLASRKALKQAWK